MSSDDQAPGAGPADPDGTTPAPQERTAAMPAQPAEETPIAELDNGRYQLVERVGAGSIGQVWRARDLTLQREVAIKTVNLATSADPSTEARFRREAVATAGLDHPNVVQIYDSGVDGHTAFLVMEFLRGPNLQTLVNREGPIPFDEAVPLLAQVAAGLGAAHAIGVTHRDVKPANVVLDSDSLQATPKLVDFGIARLNDQGATALTSTMTAIGSAAYMSPEQASGERVNSASDIYSLGCLMTTVVTGHPPFPGESPIAVARAQVYDTPTPLSQLRADCPPALDALVAALLAKDPAARPDAKQTEDALRAIAADPAAPPTIQRPTVPPEANSLTREMPPTVVDQSARSEGTSTTSTLPGSLVPTTLQTGELSGTGPGAGSATGPLPAPATRKKSSGRVRRIVVAVVVLLVLAAAVWLAWSQGRRGVSATPSSTVTMTETHSASATASSASGTETSTDTSQATSSQSDDTQPSSTATDTSQAQATDTATGGQPGATATATTAPQDTGSAEESTTAPQTTTSSTTATTTGPTQQSGSVVDSRPSTTSTDTTGQNS